MHPPVRDVAFAISETISVMTSLMRRRHSNDEFEKISSGWKKEILVPEMRTIPFRRDEKEKKKTQISNSGKQYFVFPKEEVCVRELELLALRFGVKTSVSFRTRCRGFDVRCATDASIR